MFDPSKELKELKRMAEFLDAYFEVLSKHTDLFLKMLPIIQSRFGSAMTPEEQLKLIKKEILELVSNNYKSRICITKYDDYIEICIIANRQRIYLKSEDLAIKDIIHIIYELRESFKIKELETESSEYDYTFEITNKSIKMAIKYYLSLIKARFRSINNLFHFIH